MLLEHPVEAPPLTGPVHGLADGTELLGEYQGSGFQEPRFLIRRSDGQVMQVPALLYRLACSLDGRRDDEEVAVQLSAELDQELTAEQVTFLVEEKLRPAGVVADDGEADGDGHGRRAAAVKSDPLLALRFRVGVIPERVVWHLAGPLRFLFRRPAWITVLAAFLAVCGLILARGGLVGRTVGGVEQVIRQPWLVLTFLGIQIVAATFHETGHVTACRYGGARPGDMGVGLYLVWPAFYSTVTDSYRLNRVGRLRTDLGGVYFNAVFLTGLGGLYLATDQPWLLLVLLAWLSDTVWQFLPSIRLDGYYVLADLAGVPDLFGYVLPALKSLVPGRPAHPRVRELRTWPRRVIVGWVAATIPTLLFYLAVFLVLLPHALPVAVRELASYLQTLEQAVRAGQVVEAILGVFQCFLLLLPWVGSAMITVSIAGRLRRAVVRRWGRGRVQARAWPSVRRGAALAGVGCLGVLVVLRTWQVGTSLPASPAELEATDRAVAAVTRGHLAPLQGPGDLLSDQLAGYAWLTGAFGRHASVVEAGRELAVVATAVLVGCLLVLAVRRGVRLLAVTAPLVAVGVMGPVVATLAGSSAALVGSAWTAVGLLVLARHRGRHRRRHGWAFTAVGAAAVVAGLAICPLIALPVGAGLAVLIVRGRLCGGWPAAWRRAAAVTLPLVGVALAGYAGQPSAGPIARPDRTVLLIAAVLVVVAGCAIRRLSPWTAAGGAAVLMAWVPWPGAGGALPLVAPAVVPLGVLVADALVGVPVAERPHPLLRAVLAVPVLVVTVVGGLFGPASAPTRPHAALASWINGPTAPSAPIAVPAGVWGDLVRDGVPAQRIRRVAPGDPTSQPWAVSTRARDPGFRVIARFGSGADALTVVARTEAGGPVAGRSTTHAAPPHSDGPHHAS